MASSSDSTFKFLVTTDNHLGFMERDHRRANDSFVTFEECLKAAKEYDVDAVLLAGDLFHENKPSLGCLQKTLGLLRRYVPGDKPVPFTMLSDPSVSFTTHPLPVANFQDPNLNIALPIFLINGNHDDPASGTSAIDVLSSAGLVNYFGHVGNVEDIVVRPILLQKGTTHVALYGMRNVRDERLHRCFRLQKVQFVRPKPVANVKWFNILLFHQNRGIRGGGESKGGIDESMLAGFDFDVVIWGNEHEQRMMPECRFNVDIMQPGSTVATSLSAGESNPKKFGIIEVQGLNYKPTAFPLQSIRPVVRRSVALWKDNPTGRTVLAVEAYLKEVVEEMVTEADALVAAIPPHIMAFHPNIKFPLMRMSVSFVDPDPRGSAYPMPNLQRFGQQYIEIVANAKDMVVAEKPKPRANLTARDGGAAGAGDPADAERVFRNVGTDDIRPRIEQVLRANASDACDLLSEPEIIAAIYQVIEKNIGVAVGEKITELLTTANKQVYKKLLQDTHENVAPNVDRMEQEICDMVRAIKKEANSKFTDQTLPPPQVEVGTAATGGAAVLDADTDDVLFDLGLAVAAPAAAAAGRPLPQQVINLNDDDDDLPIAAAAAPSKAPAKKRAAAPAAAAPSKSRGAKREVAAPPLQLSAKAPSPSKLQTMQAGWMNAAHK